MAITIDFSRKDLINLALAVGAAARSSYVDERLVTAATEHALAATLWAHAGYIESAQHHTALAQAIDLEAVEAAVQAALDEAEED